MAKSAEIFEETVQTDREPEVTEVGERISTKQLANTMFFELAEDPANKWSWGLWAENGKLLAVSAHDYSRRNDARKAVDILMKLEPNMKVVVRDRP